MKAPNEQEVKDAVERIEHRIHVAAVHPPFLRDMETVISALKAEQEMLDWFLDNCRNIDIVDRVFRMKDRRRAINSLRNQTKDSK